VEREAEVVDPRQRPLAGLHDDVDRAELELGEPELEAERVELGPGDSGLVRREVLADAPMARNEVEAELADVARLDFANPARHQVVVEEMHGPGRHGRQDSAAARRSAVVSARRRRTSRRSGRLLDRAEPALLP